MSHVDCLGVRHTTYYRAVGAYHTATQSRYVLAVILAQTQYTKENDGSEICTELTMNCLIGQTR